MIETITPLTLQGICDATPQVLAGDGTLGIHISRKPPPVMAKLRSKPNLRRVPIVDSGVDLQVCARSGVRFLAT